MCRCQCSSPSVSLPSPSPVGFQLFSHVRLFATPWTEAHTRQPCPSPSPRACSNSCPLSWWWNPTISSSVTPFSSCPQSFPASGSFPVSWLFTSGSQSIGVSVSPSIFPMNIQGWFSLGLTGLISLQSKGLSRVFCSTTIQKLKFFGAQPPLWSLRCAWSNYKIVRNLWEQPSETLLMPPQLPFLYSSFNPLWGGDARNPLPSCLCF